MQHFVFILNDSPEGDARVKQREQLFGPYKDYNKMVFEIKMSAKLTGQSAPVIDPWKDIIDIDLRTFDEA